MDTRRTASLYYKVRRPIPSIQALPGDLLVVHPERPPAARYVLLRETEEGLQRRILKEKEVLSAAMSLGISTQEWRRIAVPDEPVPIRAAI